MPRASVPCLMLFFVWVEVEEDGLNDRWGRYWFDAYRYSLLGVRREKVIYRRSRKFWVSARYHCLLRQYRASALRSIQWPTSSGEVQADAIPVISPVCDDDNDGKKLDKITDGYQGSDVHGSGYRHKSSGIQATVAEAEASKGLQ